MPHAQIFCFSKWVNIFEGAGITRFGAFYKLQNAVNLRRGLEIEIKIGPMSIAYKYFTNSISLKNVNFLDRTLNTRG